MAMAVDRRVAVIILTTAINSRRKKPGTRCSGHEILSAVVSCICVDSRSRLESWCG